MQIQRSCWPAVLVCAIAACKSSGTAQRGPVAATEMAAAARPVAATLPLRPAGEGRPALLGTMRVASPARLIGTLDAFAKKLGLPMPLGQMLGEQLAQAGAAFGLPLSRAQLDRLDEAAPLSAALVARTATDEPALCVAARFKDDEQARRTQDELGTAGANEGGASERKLRDDTSIWTARGDRVLLFGATRDHLVEACALALETQAAPLPALTSLTIFPEPVARWRRTTVKDAVDVLTKEMGEAAAKPDRRAKGAARAPSPRFAQSMVAFFKAALEPLAETRAAILSLDVGERDGIVLKAELEPIAQTPFAARTANVTPYVLDPQLPVRDESTAVAAWGRLDEFERVLAPMFAAGGAGGAQTSKALTSFLSSTSGGSCTVEMTSPPMRGVCVWNLDPSADPNKMLDAYVDASRGAVAWEAAVMGQKGPPLKVTRRKDTVEIQRRVVFAGMDPQAQRTMKALMGSDVQRWTVSIRGRQLVQVFSATPKGPMTMPGGAATAPPPALAAVLSRTKGYRAVMSFDVMSFVLLGLKNADTPQAKQASAMMAGVPGLSTLKTPLVLALSGGGTAGFELQLPYGTLANVVSVVRPFFGQMGGPAPAAGR